MGLQLEERLGVRLNQVYTLLVTAARVKQELPSHRRGDEAIPAESREAPQLLLDLLAERSLYVSGVLGSGKSIFCRWVTWLTCNGAMPPPEFPVPEPYPEEFPDGLRGRLPVLVRQDCSAGPGILHRRTGCRILTAREKVGYEAERGS